MGAIWTVEQTTHPRFPCRIVIEQEGRVLLAVRAQSAWPGPGAQIFCLREEGLDPEEHLEPLERVPVAHLRRLGKKLAVTLDRPRQKRCEFFRIERRGKDGRVREQIFFRTEQAARAHRTSGRVELFPSADIEVAIDSAERYPWRFPGARTVRRRLSVGDYALIEDEKPVAVVERKSLANFLTDLSQIRGFHQQLAELGAYTHSAVVIEAQYADLGKADKIGKWGSSHLLRVVGELAALHPNAPVHFAGSRKLANIWTQRYFLAVAARERQSVPEMVAEPATLFDHAPAEGGLDAEIRAAAVAAGPEGVAVSELVSRFRDAPRSRIRRVLAQLRSEGRLRVTGRGPGARWVKTGD